MAKEKEPVLEENEQETSVQEAPVTEEHPKTVKIKLFKDRDRYNSDKYVSVNNKEYQIKRGVLIEVPYEVAAVLENSLAQDSATADLIEQMESDYKKIEKLLEN